MSIIKPVNRRKFLQQSAALAAATSLPFGAYAQEHMMPKGNIITRPIPGTNEMLPIVGIGAPDIFIGVPPEGKELPKSVIQAVVDMGGRIMDAPAFFRPDDPILGELLTEMGHLQEKMFLIGKITVPGKQAGIDHANRVIKYLDKNPIDAMLVHNMNDMANNWPTVKDLKAEGKARYIGVSRTRETDFTALKDFMKAEKPDFVMTGYSITQQGAAEQDVMAIAQDMGIAMIGVEPFKAIDDGAFFSMVAGVEIPGFAKDYGIESWAQYSLKWILSDPAMTSVIFETSKASHVADNMGAGFGEMPDQKTRKLMSDFLLALA